MKKGILLIGSYPPPFGGIASHIHYLAPYLCEKGWDVHILSGGSRGIERGNGLTIYRPFRRDKIIKIIFLLLKVGRISKFLLPDLSFLRRLSGALALAGNAIQILKSNRNISLISAYHLFPEGFVGALASEELSVPLVVTNFGEIYTTLNFYKEQLSIVKYILSRSKKILSVSQHCAKSYEILDLSPQVEVLPYGIDVEKFSPKSDGGIVRQRFDIDDKEHQVVLFVGRMIRDMGLHTLLKAIPRVLEARRTVKFIIAGAKGELYEPSLRLQSEHKENVFVAPNIPFDELPYYYAASTLVVAPTPDNRACMGMAIKEAMASGKPVIASKIGGIPEAVVDGETGILIPPEDPPALAEAILELLNNKEVIVRMGRYGRRRAEDLFDKDKTNHRVEKIFREIGG